MFGYSRQDAEGKPKFHGGIDLIPDGRAALGEPVMAAEEGRVVKIVTHSNDFGNCVIMLHNSGAEVYYTYYAHLDKVLVKGLDVEAGQGIGTMGNSGNADDPHLHFEIRNRDWERLDPGPFIGFEPSPFLKNQKLKEVT